MENNNFLQRVWNGELAENQISANQVFIKENDGANEKYVQIIKLRYGQKDPKNICEGVQF